MALFPLMFTGSPHIPKDIYPIHLTIRPLKSSALPETFYSRADNIINKPEHKLAEFDHINQTSQNNGFSRHMCSSGQFLAQQTESHPRSQPPDTYSAFISIQYV